MLKNSIIASIMKMTPQGVGKWKKEERPIIKLLDQYLTKEDLEEFLKTGKILKLEFIPNLDDVLKIINNKIQEQLNKYTTECSKMEFIMCVDMITAYLQKDKKELNQIEFLKYFTDENKRKKIDLTNETIVCGYIAAISILSHAEFELFTQDPYLI